MWHEYLAQYFQKYDYPQEGACFLLSVLDEALSHDTLAPALLTAVQTYAQTDPEDSTQVTALLEKVREAAAKTSISGESVELLFFIMCMKRLQERYEESHLPMTYYDGVAADLLAKLKECHDLKGIWGTYVGSWFSRFFSMGRFSIGRLQYERIPIPESYCPPEYAHMAGQNAVNVHIPSGRPLIQREIRDSMAEAAAFFAPQFSEGKVLFICHSWLLFPGHLEMLPERSGIRAFMEEFSIAGSYEDPARHDLWRIFGTEAVDDPDTLPQKTSLQRAYVRWLKDGKTVGGGLGFRYIQV